MGMKTGQNPLDVSIQNRRWRIKGAGHNSASGGAANPRQRHPAIKIPGPGLLHQQLGCLMESTCPGVIAKALPLQAHLLQRRGSQGFHGGEPCHPALPIGQHHQQLGLLQHHLGDPDAVRRQTVFRQRPSAVGFEHPRLLSWLLTAMVLPPAQKRLSHRRDRCVAMEQRDGSTKSVLSSWQLKIGTSTERLFF